MKKAIIILISLLCTLFGLSQAPGGISSNLQLWLKADAGVAGTSSVTAWQDQSLNAHSAVAGTGPELLANEFNYNPGLDFESSNSEFLRIPSGILGNSIQNNVFVFAVSKVESISASTFFVELGNGADRLQFHTPWSDGLVYYDVCPRPGT